VGDEHPRGCVIGHAFRLSIAHISILALRNADALVVERAVTSVPAGVVGFAGGWPGCLSAVGERRIGVAAGAPGLGLPVLSALIFGAEALGSAGRPAAGPLPHAPSIARCTNIPALGRLAATDSASNAAPCTCPGALRGFRQGAADLLRMAKIWRIGRTVLS
jgi:hypothetical protein